MFLVFDHLDRSEYLDRVLCLGYRVLDKHDDRWTIFCNRVKSRFRDSMNQAASIMQKEVGAVRFRDFPVAVIPLLGSADVRLQPNSAIAKIAAAVGACPNFNYCPGVLTKPPHRKLHSIRKAADRDAEVANRYAARLCSHSEAAPTIVLLDDFVTRGATMNDAARAIRAVRTSPVRIIGVALGKNERVGYAGPAVNNEHIPQELLERAGVA